MKKKYLVYAAMPVLALALLAASTASAHSMFGFFGGNANPDEIALRQSSLFQEQATLLGVGASEVKGAWAKGQTLWDLAQEKGITQEQLREKMKAARDAQMKKNLQALVTKGVITQAQADQRYTWITTQAANGKGGKRMGVHGMHRGMMGF